ncbi:MAG: molecular chaperone DnaJ [Cyanobacteria bacterium QS_8_64_29]|nr:MAG: molecular chaperone DnaJ [Cyanobacteria bacterium QS_8_64_29]
MQQSRNYYELLNVSPEASTEQIKQAYRRLARRYHPDLNPGDKDAEETFKAIGEAYDVLCDERKRAQYDQTMRRSRHRRGAPRRRRRESRTQRARQVPLDRDDAYQPGTTKRAYKAGAAPSEGKNGGSARPRDVEAKLTLPLEKAYQGGRERVRLEDGRSLEIDMPSGMVDGQQMRLRGQGIEGGDLYLTITIAPHSLFKLHGSDVICRVPVTPSEAVLGGAIKVPTLDGPVRVSIPGGTVSGKRLRLADKGYPHSQGRGDQLVEIAIAVPSDPSEAERSLYEQLRQVEAFDPRRDLGESD